VTADFVGRKACGRMDFVREADVVSREEGTDR
jgi:hypothetical protein